MRKILLFCFCFCLFGLYVFPQNASIAQTDWAGGSGQTNFTDVTKFNVASFVDYTSKVGDISLINNTNNSFYAVTPYQDKIMVGTSYGIFIYNPQDNSWKHSYSGSFVLYHTTVHNGVLYNLHGYNIYTYDGTENDYGFGENGWKLHSNLKPLGITSTFTIKSIDNELYLGARSGYSGKALKWNDTTNSWNQIGQNFSNGVMCFEKYKGELYAGTHWSGQIFKLVGNSWTMIKSVGVMTVNDLLVFNNKLYTTGWSTSYSYGKIVSFDGGNWATAYSGYGIHKMTADANNIYFSARTANSGRPGKILKYNGTTTSVLYSLPSELYAFYLKSYNGDLYYGGLSGTRTSNFYKNGQVLEKITGGYLYSSDISNTGLDWGALTYKATTPDNTGVSVILEGKNTSGTYGDRVAHKNNDPVQINESTLRYGVYFWSFSGTTLPSVQEIGSSGQNISIDDTIPPGSIDEWVYSGGDPCSGTRNFQEVVSPFDGTTAIQSMMSNCGWTCGSFNLSKSYDFETPLSLSTTNISFDAMFEILGPWSHNRAQMSFAFYKNGVHLGSKIYGYDTSVAAVKFYEVPPIGSSGGSASGNWTFDLSELGFSQEPDRVVVNTHVRACGASGANGRVTWDNIKINTEQEKEDTIPPIITVQNITVNLDVNGTVSVTTASIDNGSSDDSGELTLSLDTATFDCNNIGENTVTLTGVDSSGNTASATALVIVDDAIAPTLITQDITVNLDSNGVALITAAQIDNASFDNCSIASMTVSPNTFYCGDIGDHIVTVNATDSNGNISTETATVSVMGAMPIISINDFEAVDGQKANTVFIGYGPQSIDINTDTTGGSDFIYSWTSSTGEILADVANPEISPLMTTTYTVEVTNSNGCTATASIEVCVIDVQSYDKKGNVRKGKVTICHHTGSGKNKFVMIDVSPDAVAKHIGNHGDTLGSCEVVCVKEQISTSSNSYDLGDENLSIVPEIFIYPNPVKNNINISLNTGDNISGTIQIHEFFGKMNYSIRVKDLKKGENINISKLKKGAYLAKVIYDGNVLVKIFIKS